MTSLLLPTLRIEQVELAETGPRVALVNRDPGPGERDVPWDSLLALEVVDTGLVGIRRQGLRLWVNDTLAVQGGVDPEISPPFAGARSSISLGPDSVRIVLEPVLPFPSLATVTLRVVAQTLDGQEHLEEQYAFLVEDRTAPRLVAAVATAPRTLRLSFDEPVQLTARSSFTLSPEESPAATPVVTAVKPEANLVSLTLTTEFTPDKRYRVSVQGVTDLRGNAVTAPYDSTIVVGFRPARPPTRHFDLWELLPAHNRRDDLTGDLRRFITCLQDVVDLLLADLDRWPEIFDLERAPEGFLDLILQDLGTPFSFSLDLPDKRRLASQLVELYQQKGTAPGIRNAVRFFLGVQISAIRPFASEPLPLGEWELGVSWVLGPSDSFSRYAFDIEVDRALAEGERRQLRSIVEFLKPAHTHFVDLLEPSPPVPLDHWELGQSDLGETTDLH